MKKMTTIILIVLAALLLYLGSAFVPAFFVGRGMDKSLLAGCLIVGHRGGASLAPENTLAALEAGINAGADMVEVDIHLTSDGQLLVCHDEKVDRTTDGHGRIDGMTLAQAQALHVVDDNGNVTDQHLPTLDETMQLVNGRCRMLIEIKRTGNIYQGIEEKLVDAIARHNAANWVVVQSFNDDVLFNMHRLAPNQPLEKLLVCKLPGLPLCINFGSIGTFSLEKYSFVQSFNFYYHGLNASLIDEIHAAGKQVKVWTLETPDDQPVWPTVDGYITNRPDAWK